MRIKRNILHFILLALCISSLFGTNYLFSNMYAPDFMAISLVIISAYVFLRNGCKIVHSDYNSTLLLGILMWVIGIVVASKYNLPWMVIFKESAYTIVPILVYFAFRPLVRRAEDILSLLHIICITAIICNVVAIVEYSSLLNGMDLIHLGTIVKIRNGTPRFIFGDSVLVIGLFASYSFVTDSKAPKRAKTIHIINLALTIVNLILVVKTRSMIMFILATILMMPVLNKNEKTQKRIGYFLAVILLLLIVVASDFVPSINTLLNNDYGMQARLSAIQHYLDYFKKNWLTGVGYLSGNSKYSTYSIVSGLTGRFYTSDVGIIGLLFTNGIIGLLWLISWFYNSIKLINKNKAEQVHCYDALMKLLVIYFAFSCINLIFTDSPRFPLIALGMIIMEASAFVTGPGEKYYRY